MKISITIYSLNQYFRQGKTDVKNFIGYCGSLGVDAVDLGYYWKDEEEEVKHITDWLREKQPQDRGLYRGERFCSKREGRKGKTNLLGLTRD